MIRPDFTLNKLKICRSACSQFKGKSLRASGISVDCMSLIPHFAQKRAAPTNPWLQISSLDLKGQWRFDLECSIRDVCPTRYAQMMNLG